MTPEFIKNIDWKELRDQKNWLLYNVTFNTKEAEECALGLINLIDAIQDDAVELGIDQDLVFGNINE